MQEADIHVGEIYRCGRDFRRVIGIHEDPEDGVVIVQYTVAPLRAVFRRTLETFADEVTHVEEPDEAHDA
jgi:hypothetical protein